MSKKSEQNTDFQKLMDQMKSMQEELNRLKTITVPSQAQPEPKFRYGLRLLKLEDGRTHIEVVGPPGEQVTVTLEDLAGLARVLDERLRFWYQQQFSSEMIAAQQARIQQAPKEDTGSDEAQAQDG